MYNYKRSVSVPDDLNGVSLPLSDTLKRRKKSAKHSPMISIRSTPISTSSSGSTINANNYIKELERKIKKFKLNNNWNTKLELKVKQLGEQAAGYKWMHDNAAGFWSTISAFMTIINVTLGALVSVVLSASIIAQLDAPWIYIFSGVSVLLTALSIILTTAIKIMGLDGRTQKHKESAKNFNNFYLDTMIELSKFRRNRYDAIKYVRQINREFIFYDIAAPDIPGIVNWRYGRKIKGMNLTAVGIMDNAIEIETGDLEDSITSNTSSKQRRKRRETAKKQLKQKQSENRKLHKQMTKMFQKGTTIKDVLKKRQMSSESECDSVVASEFEDIDLDLEKGEKTQDPHNDPHRRYQIERFVNEI